MEAMEAILTRRSIRKYTDRAVSDETVRELLNAAMNAPTAGDQRPWEFVVIRDRAVLDAVPSFHPHSLMLKHAPVGILICGDVTREKYPGRWPLDCSAAAENILIASNALGLGAVWLALHPVQERIDGMRHLVGVPEHVVPFCIVSLGYPGEKKAPPDRYDAERVHYDRW